MDGEVFWPVQLKKYEWENSFTIKPFKWSLRYSQAFESKCIKVNSVPNTSKKNLSHSHGFKNITSVRQDSTNPFCLFEYTEGWIRLLADSTVKTKFNLEATWSTCCFKI